MKPLVLLVVIGLSGCEAEKAPEPALAPTEVSAGEPERKTRRDVPDPADPTFPDPPNDEPNPPQAPGPDAGTSRSAGIDQLSRLALDPRAPIDERAGAITALADHPRGKAQAGLLVEVLRRTEDSLLRRRAALAIGALGAREFSVELLEVYRKDGRLEVRKEILRALGRLGDDRTLDFLEAEALRAEASPLRLYAAQAVHATGGARARSILERHLRRETDPGIRRHLERWLSR